MVINNKLTSYRASKVVGTSNPTQFTYMTSNRGVQTGEDSLEGQTDEEFIPIYDDFVGTTNADMATKNG